MSFLTTERFVVSDNGANPMRWDCDKQGCFNRIKRPKIEVFASCLPGRISFGDVDGLVEIKGNLLFLEFKCHNDLPVGQRILYERITSLCPATVLIIHGDSEHMIIENFCVAWKGKIGDREEADLESLKGRVRSWALWASSNPATPRR